MKKDFKITHYNIATDKIEKGCPIKFVFVTDLHGSVFGDNNQDLLHAIQKENPDAVLIAGDLNVRTNMETMDTAEAFVGSLAKHVPVFYALGNHEYYVSFSDDTRELYSAYECRLKKEGVVFLRNEKKDFTFQKQIISLYGLELPLEYYKKPISPKLTKEEIDKRIGEPLKDRFSILLAHNPKYGKTYFEWGADLTLCGHYHGGILRFCKHYGAISPQYQIFPPYCCGDYHENNRHMLVSAGLGEHTIPLRIHNPRELLVITITSS